MMSTKLRSLSALNLLVCYPVSLTPKANRSLIFALFSANEFVAYSALQNNATYALLTDRSRLIATYALCGFANIASLGTQIGVLQQVAPGRGGDVSRLAVSALLSGALSTLTSASVAGMVLQDPSSLLPSKV